MWKELVIKISEKPDICIVAVNCNLRTQKKFWFKNLKQFKAT